MVSFLNKPMGSVCISPIQWLRKSLQQDLPPLTPALCFCPHFKPTTPHPLLPTPYLFLPPFLIPSLSQYLLCFAPCHFICVYDSLSNAVSLCVFKELGPDSQLFPSHKLSLYLLQVLAKWTPCPTFFAQRFRIPSWLWILLLVFVCGVSSPKFPVNLNGAPPVVILSPSSFRFNLIFVVKLLE